MAETLYLVSVYDASDNRKIGDYSFKSLEDIEKNMLTVIDVIDSADAWIVREIIHNVDGIPAGWDYDGVQGKNGVELDIRVRKL